MAFHREVSERDLNTEKDRERERERERVSQITFASKFIEWTCMWYAATAVASQRNEQCNYKHTHTHTLLVVVLQAK